MNINLVQVCGRMTANPEIINTQNGTQIAKFSVASNRTWKNKNSGQKEEEVEFHNIVAFGEYFERLRNALNAKYSFTFYDIRAF